MNAVTEKITTQWKDAANLVLGVWLALSPWILSFADEAAPAWNARVVGVIIAVAAVAALSAFQEWEEWVNAALAAWLIVSPYVLGFSMHQAVLWNHVVVGVVVGALAIWSAVTTSSIGRLSARH
jgi:hypothetical protein